MQRTQRAQIAISLAKTPKGDVAVFRLAGFLGSDLFGKYRACIEGARYEASDKSNRAPLAVTMPILHRLKDAGFTAELSTELRDALKALTAQRKLFIEKAATRTDAVEEVLKKRGLGLYPFQRIGIEWLAGRSGALLADEMGCVDGEAVVSYSRAGVTRKTMLANLHRKFNGGESGHGKRWDLSIPTYVKSLCGDELRLNRIRRVLDKGVKPVVKVSLASGKSIRVTPDHEIAVRNENWKNKIWLRADSLRVGDLVLTNGKFVDKGGYVRVCGLHDHPRNHGGQVYEHILVYEAHLGRHVRADEIVHHKNEDPSDNRLENLELLPSSSEHMRHHGRNGGYRRLDGAVGGKGGEVVFFPRVDRVVGVEDDGTAHVYDIVCADPHRNFVANGIVVHNCGKTIQALIAAPTDGPLLVVCPSSLKGTWVAEAGKWRPDITCISVLKGRGSFRWPMPHEMVIVNYDILPAAAKAKDAFEPELTDDVGACPDNVTMVMDEGHALKNAKAKRTMSTRALANAVRAHGGRTWVVTATPVLNNPSEGWAVMQAAGVAQEAFGSYKQFFALNGGSVDQWGGVRWSSQPDESVAERYRRVSLRREKAQVLSELPDKTYKELVVDLDAKTGKLLDKLVKALADAGVDLDSAEALAKASHGKAVELETVSEIRAAIATAKIPAMIDVIESYEDANEPLVVFSRHRAPVDALIGREGWAVITGDNSKDAQAIAERFQRGDLKGVAGTIQAMGVGITLTRSSNVLFVDRDWTPALNAQAEDRTHRIGQKNAVVVTDLLLDHTLEKHVHKTLRRKDLIISRSIEASAIGAEEKPEAYELTEDELRAMHAECVADAQDREGEHAEYNLGMTGAKPQFFAPRDRREEWAAEALEMLTGLDPDRAGIENGMGWNKLDGGIGHSLTVTLMRKQGLTDKQWKLAIRICRKYHRQVGPVPAKEEGE